MNNIFIFLIGIYQKTFSPDHGWPKQLYQYGFCRHVPSCSEYAKQALEKHGTIRGVWLAAKRIIRCNPYSAPGWDPVPKI